MKKFTVDFEPVGRRITVSDEVDLLTAAQEAGMALTAVCGGVGICEACKIRIVSGELSDVQLAESEAFSDGEITQGWRLACQAYPRSDLKIEVPPESMTTLQRLQIEGPLQDVTLSPAVNAQDITLSPPGLNDLRADWERFTELIYQGSQPNQVVEPLVLSQFSHKLRELGWSARVIMGNDQQVIGFLERSQPYYGIAVDIGTTKVAAFLVDLTSGKTVAKLGAMNPQIAYGEDVVSRIAYANKGDAQRMTLQHKLVDTVNELTQKLCHSAGINEDHIVDFVVVGNTAMHHLFAGLAVQQLGQAPYVAAVRQAIRFSARAIGLLGAPGAQVFLPPNIAGYVGADHVAMLYASNIQNHRGIALALDIGTNTEISLSKEGRFISCSCASGPAFEGAHIYAGMRAVPGAIERAKFYDGDWHVSTIEGQPPVGICGSGILDVVAGLFESGQIDATGRFTEKIFRPMDHEKGGAIVLVPGNVSGTGKDILVTRADIREIQLAKAAIRAGISALLRATDTQQEDIDRFVVAGAFGTYINLESAIQIEMFPILPRDRFHQIGNAAGTGAQEMLISQPSRAEVEGILSRMSNLELTTDPGFMESYVDFIGFD